MTRRQKIERTAPGEGHILVHKPVAALIERHGITAIEYIRLVRSGQLDTAKSPERFNSMESAVMTLRESYLHTLPDSLPEISGVVTWRRGPRKWSLDVQSSHIDKRVRFWSSSSRGLSQVTVEGFQIPETLMPQLPGMIFSDIVDHDCFRDRGIIIHRVDVFPPARNAVTGNISIGSTQFQVEVPTIAYPDPRID